MPAVRLNPVVGKVPFFVVWRAAAPLQLTGSCPRSIGLGSEATKRGTSMVGCGLALLHSKSAPGDFLAIPDAVTNTV